MAEIYRYLAGEVELTAGFSPDVEGNMKMEYVRSMDMSFAIGDRCYNVHVDVKERNGVFIGEIQAGPKEIEAMFELSGVDA